MNTFVNTNAASRSGLLVDVHTFVNACLQPMPAMARVCSRSVTAFGVVGFLRVKDEQKCVPIAEASASACNTAPQQAITTTLDTGRGQQGDKPNTKRKQTDDRRATKGIRSTIGVRNEP